MEDEYRFARACAAAWLQMQNIPCDQNMKPTRVAAKLGRVENNGNQQEAMEWIINWHQNALRGNHSQPDATDAKVFYNSQAWRRLRYEALRRSAGKCELCGSPPGEHPLQVDHIKPRSKFPHLALQLSNLQVLCRDCNFGKGNLDEINWRSGKAFGSEKRLRKRNPFLEQNCIGTDPYSEGKIGSRLRAIMREPV